MGKFYPELPQELVPWIEQQHCFWVATAPLSPDGHVNVSPKGTQDGRIFHIVDSKSCYYLDLTGSGNETISHIYEPHNARVTILFSAFTGPPRILRLFGRGRVHELGSPAFNALIPPGSAREAEVMVPGTRAIVWLDIHQVGTSCGYSVPYYDFRSYRRALEQFSEKRIENDRAGRVDDGLERYWAWKNQKSMDGLPGLAKGVELAKRDGVKPLEMMVGIKDAYDSRLSRGLLRRAMEWSVVLLLGALIGVLLTLTLQQRGHTVLADLATLVVFTNNSEAVVRDSL